MGGQNQQRGTVCISKEYKILARSWRVWEQRANKCPSKSGCMTQNSQQFQETTKKSWCHPRRYGNQRWDALLLSQNNWLDQLGLMFSSHHHPKYFSWVFLIHCVWYSINKFFLDSPFRRARYCFYQVMQLLKVNVQMEIRHEILINVGRLPVYLNVEISKCDCGKSLCINFLWFHADCRR